MKIGIKRFNYYLDQLEALFVKAAKQKNPGLWLYQHNARTPLFMLEGLAKLYAGLHNRKKFEKIKASFKLLEDVLGAIDYYDAFSKEFSKNKKIPATVTGYLQAQVREKVQSLNEILTEKEWITEGNERLVKIRKTLSKIEWLKAEKEVNAIDAFYGTTIYEIAAFTQDSHYHFTNVESEVHELRRKLRWLSIYPQALQGCIQLGKNKDLAPHLKKYLVKEITGSPFNIMPPVGENPYLLLLEKNYFYCLSWMIAKLGQLKDDGLRVIAIKEALQQTAPLSDAIAFKKAYSYLGKKQLTLEKILIEADKVAKEFFDEQNLEHLVMGVFKVNE